MREELLEQWGEPLSEEETTAMVQEAFGRAFEHIRIKSRAFAEDDLLCRGIEILLENIQTEGNRHYTNLRLAEQLIAQDQADMLKEVSNPNAVRTLGVFFMIFMMTELDEAAVRRGTATNLMVGPHYYRLKPNTPPGVREFLELSPESGTGSEQLAAITGPNLSNILRTFSMPPAQTVDRAARSFTGWQITDNNPPRFLDPRNSHAVEYFREGEPLEVLRERVMHLNPRSADVWRLITATSLENWPRGQNEPESVWIDVRKLLEVMGYQKHHKGGYKLEHVEEVARALVDLDSFHITIPYGSQIYPEDPKTGKRKKSKLEAIRQYKVLFISAKDELRDLFGNRYPMRWKLKPGEWIKSYPRQFAPIYRALVELPAKRGKYTWAKAIGTELSYQYRQDRERRQEKKIKVATLLDRACLLEEARRMKANRKRVREYFEGALDVLAEIGVCKTWEYHGPDIDAVDLNSGPWFEPWLEAHVIVTAPAMLIDGLPTLSKNKKDHTAAAP